jgi:hypothetical protein
MAMTPQFRAMQARYRMLATRCAVIAACGLLAAACGSAAAPSSGTSGAPGTGSASSGSPAKPSSPAKSGGPVHTTSAAQVSLDVTLAGANLPARHWIVRCDPPGGTHQDPAALCAKLIANKDVLSKLHPVHIMCPMIMADARAFLITGTFFGHKVHETVVDGGCDLSRWATLNQIFN